MSLTEEVAFDNSGNVERFPVIRKLFLSLVIVLVALLAFGIGRLTSTGENGTIRVEKDPQLTTDDRGPTTNTQSANALNSISNTQVVGSKNGTKYHYSHCPGAKQIVEKNLITFPSASAAEASGYTLATNCK